MNEGRWDIERAEAWARDTGWLCGFNYIPATAINYVEMWQERTFDPRTIDAELALAEDVGFNCIRVFLQHVVWRDQHAAFVANLDAFLRMCERRGMRAMLVPFDDCAFSGEDPFVGRQPDVVPGQYANGWTPSPGYRMVRDPSTWGSLEGYVRDVIGRFGQDEAVLAWDVYNEPSVAQLEDRGVCLLKEVFAWARGAGPSQPLTAGWWSSPEGDSPHMRMTCGDLVLEHSDVITFHNYCPLESSFVPGVPGLAEMAALLAAERRPLLCTEWLCRWGGSVPASHLPWFKAEGIGCMHWGLVNGKTQTHYRWGSTAGAPEPEVWQHDLFRSDHSPYDPAEIDLFKATIAGSTTGC